MKTYKYLTLVLLLCSFGCGRHNVDGLEQASEESVVNTEDYPAVVMIAMPGGRGICSGTFVSPNTVLTAAHCTQIDGTYTIVSSFGNFRTSEKVNFGAGTIDDSNDISLLILDEDVADESAGQVYRLGTAAVALERVRLVGFGCSDLIARSGAGVKRTGTNQIYQVSEYIELLTPDPAASQQNRGVLGAANRAGTCFGDSGSALLREQGGQLYVLGVSHAGGSDGSQILSQFTDLNRADNYNYLKDYDDAQQLGIFDVCDSAEGGYRCTAQNALVGLVSFLKMIWNHLVLFIR